nr:thyroid adenoma-associated protein homolog [Drosophila bipectinata]
MNDLNLRVAALKLCAHPKRFAELRDALVPLPERWSSDSHEFVSLFAKAQSSAEQVLAVKELFYKDKDLHLEKIPLVELFLADLLFASPLKHAVRNQLTRLFSDKALAKKVQNVEHGHTKDSLLKALLQALKDLIGTDLELRSHDSINDIFVSANACLQNFPYGHEILGESLELLIPLLPLGLERYWKDISDTSVELSPTRRNELYLYLQNVLRFLVSLLSEWSSDLGQESCQALLRRADAIAQKVARHVDTPWDVRSIAGLLIGHLARLSGGFSGYLQHCARAEAEPRDLPIQTAALLVLQPLDYPEHAPVVLSILQAVLAVGQREGNVSNLLVYLSKHLFIYSKSLGDVEAGFYQSILPELQGFALQHLASPTDSVRHMSSGLFRQTLQHAQAAGQVELFQVVYKQFEERSASLGASCLALEHLVGVVGVAEALNQCPSLVKEIFPRFLGLEDSVDSLFRAMMVAAHKAQTFEDWHRLWFTQLLEALQVPEKRRSAVEHLMTQAVQLEPTALVNLLLKDGHLPLSSKLAAILSVRQLSKRRQEFLSSLKPELEQALLGLDDHTRLLALRFVVETPRPSDPLSREEAEAIKLYLKHNANNPSAHLRQLGYGLLQKALQRIRLGLAEHQKRPSPAGKLLRDLLLGLMQLLARNLFPSANYGRRWLSLHLLRDCVDLCRQLELREWEEELPSVALRNLELCLGDSYEQNKVLVARLLEKLQAKSDLNPVEIMELLLSLRPPDSVTGAFQLQVYCRVQEVSEELPAAQLPEDISQETRIYAALQWCLEHLREGLSLAQKDLAQAAKLNPLYGLLFASRHLLQQMDLKQLAKEPAWRQYVHDLVAICLEVSRVVLPVVSSASPEGHLPETRDQETDQPLTNVLSRRLASEALQQVKTTPQMVLLCAWRSIKEVSLILGELVERAPLEEEERQKKQQSNPEISFLLSSQQLEEIGELFLLLLAETKHRGAFEQAYVGFQLLCRRFWHSDAVRLNQLPNQWVSEAMSMVSGAGDNDQKEQKTRLCSTRRSAGMPFMLQALICTELKLGTHATLHRCMQRLLEVCEERSATPAGVTARSHALNILRALFRCSELAELVTEFVARGIRCALESLLAEEWAERNCATLLLAALVVRVFGVERARLESGELHVRNRMTGRIFFTRYPELFDYFHAGLQREADQMAGRKGGQSGGNEKRRQTVQLEAMLLMLSRLYPSSLEGAESSLNLSKFVPFLLKICRSHDLMTRERAALVVANFVSQDQALAEIRRIVVGLKALQLKLKLQKPLHFNGNHWHGQLLLLLQMQRLVRWTSPSLARMQLHTLASLAAPFLQLNACVFGALLDVMAVVLEEATQLDGCLLKALSVVLELDQGDISRRCGEQGISTRCYQVVCLHLRRLGGNTEALVQHLEELGEDYSRSGALAVELWLYVLLQRSQDADQEVDHFNFASDTRKYFNALSPGQRQEVTLRLYESQRVRSCVLKMVESPRCWGLELDARLTALQPLLRDPGLDLEKLLQRCKDTSFSWQHPGLVLSLKRLIEEKRRLEWSSWLPILEYALRLVDPVQPNYLRFQAAELCHLLGQSGVKSVIGSSNADIVGSFIRLVLLLLLDEAEWVRHRAALLVVEQSGDDKVILPSVLIPRFLKSMLRNVRETAPDSEFVTRLFQLISEPFVASKDNEEQAPDLDAEVEVFDKQEINLYCESLLVLCQVAVAFRENFAACQTVMNTIDSLGLPADLVD